VTEKNDSLTRRGMEQAEQLGNDWKDVRIDVLQSSTLQRAHLTALGIARHNHDTTLEVATDDIYVERRMGQAVIDALYAGDGTKAMKLLNGSSPGQDMIILRDHQSPGGGESLNDVAFRASLSLTVLLRKYGKEMDEPPREFLDKTVIDSPNVLPEGIPHVVVVSHNLFLIELYEAMFSWNGPYRITTCDYRNMDW
jgi:broad specificity phosphatase PhoE